MTDWTSQLAGTFGAVDGEFAVHKADRARAVAMLKAAKKAGAELGDVLNALRTFADGKAWSPEHTDRQIGRLHALLFEEFPA